MTEKKLPQRLRDALQRVAVARGYECPDVIIGRHQPPKARTRPVLYWKREQDHD